MGAEKSSFDRLSPKTWVALAGTLVLLSGAMTAGFSYVFSTKAELKRVELKQADTGEQSVVKWRLQTLEVQVANLQTRTERVDKNVVTIMERFRLVSEPIPNYQPLPPPPSTP